MVPYIHRHMVSKIEVALDSARIVNLVSPRQAGKTTLVKELLGRGHFITLDDDQTLNSIENHAYGLIASLLSQSPELPVIIDEAQRSKTLPLALKRIVDSNPRTGQFLLTGSSNVYRTMHVTDSLAGRVQTVELPPLTAAEINGVPVPKLIEWGFKASPKPDDIPTQGFSRAEVIDFILRGGFPEIRELPLKTRSRRYLELINQVIDRDVRYILNICNPDSFRRLINRMAARTAIEINVSLLSNYLLTSRATIEQYLDILERLNLLVKLEPWSSGEYRKDIKNAKFHFADSGLLSAIRRLSERSFDLGSSPIRLGSVFESYVVNELIRTIPFLNSKVGVYHWQSSNSRKIDMVVERDTKLVGIQIIASTSPRKKVIDDMRWFAQEGAGRNRQFTGLIIYLGDQLVPLGDRIFAVPVSALWS